MTAELGNQQLFDVRSAAGYLQALGASAATVNFIRTIVASGEVPHIRIGKKFYVSRQSLDGWVTRHERRSR
jgi:hypothetical protein